MPVFRAEHSSWLVTFTLCPILSPAHNIPLAILEIPCFCSHSFKMTFLNADNPQVWEGGSRRGLRSGVHEQRPVSGVDPHEKGL